MIRSFKKLILSTLAMGVFVVFTLFTSTINAKAEITECIEIAALPAIITVQGIYCFKQNLVTSITTGHAIEIQTNNVTIDMNGFKLGGSTAGTATQANGIYALNGKNITIRNGNIRGFYRAIYLFGSLGSGHLIEHIRADGNRSMGLFVAGDNNIIRYNQIINTGPGTFSTHAYGINILGSVNTLIADNIISGVSEITSARGVYINNSAAMEISGNSIFDINTATSKYGVDFVNSEELTFQNNRIINPAGTGSIAIFDSGTSTGIDCVENTIRGYDTGLSGCDYTSNNHINGEAP